MKNAVIYARFSSDKQSELSIEAQVRACKEFAKANGLNIKHVYKDEAVSGTTANRTAYQEMLSDAFKGRFEAILIHKYDRISRNLEEQVTLNTKLTKLGIELIAVAQNFGSGKEANLSKGIQWVLGEYYSENLSEETRKGLKETALRALHNGGYAPFGYDIKDRRYVINEIEASYVKQMFKACIEGKSYENIIRSISAAGLKGRRGKEIGYSSIYEILRNEKYTGTYRYEVIKGDPKSVVLIEDAFPAIISNEEFMKAADVMAKRSRSGPHKKHPCSGLVYCECGAKMHHNHTVRNGHEYQTFYCSAHCGNRIVPDEEIEKIVQKYLTGIFSEKNISEVEFAVRKELNIRKERTKSFEQSRKERITQKEKELSNIVSALFSGKFNDNYEYLNELITIKRKEIEELKNIKEEQPSDELKAWLKSLKDSPKAPKVFIKKIIVKENEISIISTLTSLVGTPGCGGADPLVPTININYSYARL